MISPGLPDAKKNCDEKMMESATYVFSTRTADGCAHINVHIPGC
jgi:hypothetical protein